MDLPRLIVLRIWAGADRFRAVAREPESDQTRAFSEPQQLLSFLLGGDAAAPAASAGDKAPPPAATGTD